VTYAHTLSFTRFKTSTLKTKPLFPVFGFYRFWFFRTDRSRSTIRVDRRAQTVHVHVGRPLWSAGHSAVLSVSLGRPGGRPMSPNGRKYDRWWSTVPVDRLLSEILTDSNSYIFWLTFCWDLTPTDLFSCLLVFSSPINRRSFQHDLEQDLHWIFSVFKKTLEKIFNQSQNF